MVKPSSPRQTNALKKILKPAHTQIHISKSEEQLEIYIPPRNSWIVNLIFTFFLVYLLVTIIVLSKWTVFFASLLIFWTPLSIGLLKLFCEKTRIYFDRKQFQLERQTLSFIYDRQKSYIADILGVFLSKSGNLFEVIIRSRTGNYRLIDKLSDNECAWLAQEIQDWLNYK